MFRIRSVFTGVAGTPWYVNMHFEGSISTEAQAAAASVNEFWTAIKGNLYSGVSVQVDPTAAVIDPATGNQTGQLPVNVPPVTMTGGGSALPFQDQILVRLTTGSYVGGRQIQGRIFIPGPISATATGAGILNPSTRTAVQAATEKLNNDAKLVVYSKARQSSTRVVTVSTWDRFGTMRSRRD